MTMEKNDDKIYSVFISTLLEKKVYLHINEIGKRIKENLEKKLSYDLENKCIKEGIIQNGSIKIINYTSGNVMGEKICFHCVLECYVCNPVEGSIVECDVKTITKAGIHCEHVDNFSDTVPLHVFIARDHNINNDKYNNINEKDKIKCKIIGTRYELNDPYITCIATM
jgi:DNA-directed RNA polymerase subunit E'/Rpb7